MLSGFLLEYMGTLLVMASIFVTHANPWIVGVAYSSALLIADGKSEGYFSPLGVLVQLIRGRMTLSTSGKLVGAQLLAALSVLLISK